MNNDLRRFAPIGLVLSGLGLLTVTGLLVVRAFIAFGLYTRRMPSCSTAS
jgi:hypothetical protein